jgi:hypothetical protein
MRWTRSSTVSTSPSELTGANDRPASTGNARRRLFAAFMTFGLLNNGKLHTVDRELTQSST